MVINKSHFTKYYLQLKIVCFVLFVDLDLGIHSVDSITDIKADINKTYRCLSATEVHMGNVTITLRDVTIQAYLSNNNFSKEGKVLG